VSGKTGTAQVISTEGGRAAKGKTDKDLRDNGWFVFFAPRDNPQIAGVVFVEHSGHGGTWAAPIAKHVLETFFAKQDGQPLPPPPLKKGTPPPPPAVGDDPPLVLPPRVADNAPVAGQPRP
jgi:penicillin-binding protein 2